MFLRTYCTFVHSVQQWIRYAVIPATSSSAEKSYNETSGAPDFSDCDELNIIIPGNPGIDLFYDVYAQFLHENRRQHCRRTRTIVVAHSNHVRAEAEGARNSAKSARKSARAFTDLHEQVTHKIEFIKALQLPPDVRINLIGHSIGSWMCLRLAPRLAQLGCRLNATVCLFPTIERMQQTPEGRKFVRMRSLGLFWVFMHILSPLVHYCIPDWLKTKLIRWWCGAHVNDAFIQAVLEATHPNNIANYLNMSITEIWHVVKELDVEMLRQAASVSRCVLYYGQSDHWCPVEYGRELEARQLDGVKVVFCDSQCRHAFVIDDSEVMAVKTSDFLH